MRDRACDVWRVACGVGAPARRRGWRKAQTAGPAHAAAQRGWPDRSSTVEHGDGDDHQTTWNVVVVVAGGACTGLRVGAAVQRAGGGEEDHPGRRNTLRRTQRKQEPSYDYESAGPGPHTMWSPGQHAHVPHWRPVLVWVRVAGSTSGQMPQCRRSSLELVNGGLAAAVLEQGG